MYLVILKNPRARFPYLIGNFPKKIEAQKAKAKLESEGLRKGESVEVVGVLASNKRHAEHPGNALDQSKQRGACAIWLKSFLTAGPVESESVLGRAAQLGFSEWTVRHAAKLIGAHRFRRANRWWTELGPRATESAD